MFIILIWLTVLMGSCVRIIKKSSRFKYLLVTTSLSLYSFICKPHSFGVEICKVPVLKHRPFPIFKELATCVICSMTYWGFNCRENHFAKAN